MKTRVSKAIVSAAACLAFAASVLAHHGAANFDSKQVTLKGSVTEWLWANPHCFLKIDVKDDNGTVQNWSLEMGNPTDLSVVGFRRLSFKVGDQVTATINPVKSGASVGRVINVVLPDGQRLPQQQAPVTSPQQ
jgi:Family of unknown function (DUF6152)